MAYDDAKYSIRQHIHMGTGHAAQSSALSARVEIDRKTMLAGVTIKDWNIQTIVGFTCTGSLEEGYDIALSKSLGGTGTVTPFGSYSLHSAADATIFDATLTETNLVAGDDLVVSYEVGTALGDTGLRIEADVMFIEHFTGG